MTISNKTTQSMLVALILAITATPFLDAMESTEYMDCLKNHPPKEKSQRINTIIYSHNTALPYKAMAPQILIITSLGIGKLPKELITDIVKLIIEDCALYVYETALIDKDRCLLNELLMQAHDIFGHPIAIEIGRRSLEINGELLNPMYCQQSLVIASSDGLTEIVKFILHFAANKFKKNDPENIIFYQEKYQGQTAFHYAALNGHNEILKTLILFTHERFSNNLAEKLVFTVNTARETALDLAILTKRHQTIQDLLNLITDQFGNDITWQLICLNKQHNNPLIDSQTKEILHYYNPKAHHQKGCTISSCSIQ